MSDIVKHGGISTVATPDAPTWATIKDMAAVAARSGMVPDALKGKTDDVMVILLTSRELGLPMMAALQNIYVVHGRPTLKTEMLLALAYERIPGFTYDVLESTDERCTVQMSREGQSPVSMTYTAAQALAAGRTNDVWKKDKTDMLRWSATRKCLRLIGAGLGWMLSVPVTDDDEADESPTPPPHEPSGAAVVAEDAASVLTAGLESLAKPAPVKVEAPAATHPGSRVKAIGEELGYSFKFKGGAQRLSNYIIELAKWAKLPLKITSFDQVTSDEWPQILEAAEKYLAWKKSVGASSEDDKEVGTDAPPADVPQDDAPPLEMYAAVAEAEPQDTPEAMVKLCKWAAAAHDKKDGPGSRKFATEYKESMWFVDQDILQKLGYTRPVDISGISQVQIAQFMNEVRAAGDAAGGR